MSENLTTPKRDYGHAHRTLRTQLLPLAYGNPCPRCGEEMRVGEELDLDHTDDRNGYLGMAHSSCNRRAGGMKAGLVTGKRSAIPRQGRVCGVCGQVYRANDRDQRTCSRACGYEFRRRNTPPSKVRPVPLQIQVCGLCGDLYMPRQSNTRYCSRACAMENNARVGRDKYRTKHGIPVDPSQPTTPCRPRPSAMPGS